jgi:hypothetical protein
MREPFVDAILVQAPIAAAYAAVVGLVVISVIGLGWESVR